MKKLGFVVIALATIAALGLAAYAIGTEFASKATTRKFRIPVEKTAKDIDKPQAELIAKNLLAKLGVEGPVTRSQIERVPLSSQNNVWSVDFGDDGSVSIDAQTRRVINVVNGKLYKTSKRLAKLTAAEAKAKAIEKAKTLGLELDERALIEEPKPVINSGDHPLYWLVKWKRTYEGIPYIDDWIAIAVESTAGELLYYTYRYPSQEPQSNERNLDHDQAREKAQSFMNQHSQNGRTLNEAANGKLVIVNPNSLWTPESGQSEPVSEAAIAWEFELDNGSRIWVSVKDGTILGGKEIL